MGFAGFNKVEWPDIYAFMRAARVRLSPWEISLIEDVDDIFIEAMSEAKEGTGQEKAAAAADGLRRAGKRSVTARKGGADAG